ncbi:tryptophan halogenase, partial [mine drainage metagenome]
ERLATARLATEVEATGSYSYRCTRAHGERHLVIGDAYSFVDPVFSSGVLFATVGGIAAAEALDVCLREPPGGARRCGASSTRCASGRAASPGSSTA